MPVVLRSRIEAHRSETFAGAEDWKPMPNIPTGFRVNPLVGGIDEQQRLARYLPMLRFRQLLEERGLWFTRALQWRDGDACEASLLPAYREYLHSSFRAEPEYLHLKALMEFQLRANLGCCFSMFDGTENDLMRPPDYGVKIVVRARAIHAAVAAQSGGRHYLAKVKYLTDQQAQRMRVADCPHFRVKDGQKSWDVSECAFFKRSAFSPEREVRCVISAQESWTVLFHQFLAQHGIQELHPATPTPTDQPYLRVDMRDSMHLVSPRDRVAFISLAQMQVLTQKIETECEAYLDASASPATSRGINVPFNLEELEEIIVHPQVVRLAGPVKEGLVKAVDAAGLSTRLRNSELYASSW